MSGIILDDFMDKKDVIHYEGPGHSVRWEFIDKLEQKLNLNFHYGYDSLDTIPNVTLKIYTAPCKCSLEEALEGFLHHLYGTADFIGHTYGYSEYTIEGMNINSFVLGGHHIESILKSLNEVPWVHVVMEY